MGTKRKDRITVGVTALILFGFLIGNIAKSDDTVSISERRKLAQFPKINVENMKDGTFMSGFESYAKDQFSLREQFRALKTAFSMYVLGQRDQHGLYSKDGYIAKMEYPLHADSLQYAATRFGEVYDRYLSDTDTDIYLAIVPDKSYFLADENDYPSMDYDVLAEQVRNGMEYAQYIDIFGDLQISDYYHTDAHWRQEQITDVVRRLAGAMGVELTQQYETKELEKPFYGVYYGQLALPVKPDTLYYLDNDMLDHCTVYDYEDHAENKIYDLTKTEGNDLYEIFLGGSKSLLSIENPNAKTDRELVMFRDSFGSSIAPLLADGYAKITLVDIRYLPVERIGNYINFKDQDVLFLYSTSVLNHSETLK
jgi:hypothetical protein